MYSVIELRNDLPGHPIERVQVTAMVESARQLAVDVAVERGLIDFAEEGKERVRLMDLLRHQDQITDGSIRIVVHRVENGGRDGGTGDRSSTNARRRLDGRGAVLYLAGRRMPPASG